jgi:hypothetical protein
MNPQPVGAPSPLLGVQLRRISLVFLLVIGGGLGCVRTTSIGRADNPPDAHADRVTDAVADSDATTAPDVRTDAAVDQGPIVGGGHDGADGPDAADATP